ncbi:hypothetical protein GYMLUDRAFT_470665 [Collybiopsis luxurians FD-317 M1]|uniref:Uncharacterized protein n=1 Tax=Collybiopsis luxurians FD-317 M1 TaxID=944289 RepID=A0A0D0B7Z9_9AGAR|nr:hypothetical protein GYMLUDRAFT_470665 [Collybiopsis luxurians FD-317 M1]
MQEFLSPRDLSLAGIASRQRRTWRPMIMGLTARCTRDAVHRGGPAEWKPMSEEDVEVYGKPLKAVWAPYSSYT